MRHVSQLKDKAQTAIELAIFGSILIFVIGLIVREGMSAATTQNINLKAFRTALTLSYEYSHGLKGDRIQTRDPSRNSASVIFLEDRLTVSSGQHMAIDRIPQLVGAQGTLSRNLMYPADYGEYWNLPVVDLYINGKHFPFTSSRLKLVSFAPPGVACPTGPRGNAWEGYQCMNDIASWEPNCMNDGTGNYTIGCNVVYFQELNHPALDGFCYHNGVGLGGCAGTALDVDSRFDLDRNGTTDVPVVSDPGPPPCSLGPSPTCTYTPSTNQIRQKFNWQWNRQVLISDKNNQRLAPSFSGLNFSIGYPSGNLDGSFEADMDGDLKEETVKYANPFFHPQGVWHTFGVIDSQEGDMDFTLTDSDIGIPSPGVNNDAQMYTFVKSSSGGDEGTYLLVEEGRLFNPSTKQFIRTVQKKDSVDVIQRSIQLSNNTGRFCDISPNDPVPPQYVGNHDKIAWWYINPTKNPVEVCCDEQGKCCTQNGICSGILNDSCFTTSNVDKTCMRRGDKSLTPPRYPLIYVRSRLLDRQGRKWVTDESTDDYISIFTP